MLVQYKSTTSTWRVGGLGKSVISRVALGLGENSSVDENSRDLLNVMTSHSRRIPYLAVQGYQFFGACFRV